MSNNSLRYQINKNKYLLESEAARLEHLLRSHLKNDPRNCTLLFLGLHTGARAQELLNLTLNDINFEEESLFIKGIKGSNDRELPIPNWLFREVRKLSETPNPKSTLFGISYVRLTQVWDLYRPVPKKFHSLRHTFAIRLYRKTKDIRLVQLALGHRNIMNTMVYADYVYSQQELKKLIL